MYRRLVCTAALNSFILLDGGMNFCILVLRSEMLAVSKMNTRKTESNSSDDNQ